VTPLAAAEAPMPEPEPYADSIAHLLAELARLDLLVRQQVGRLRRGAPQADPFEGLYITDAEIDALMARTAGMPRWLEAEPDALDHRVDATLRALSGAITSRVAASRRHGIALRLERLVGRCGLSTREAGILLIALAPDIDPRYQRFYAYLQDDVTRRRPTVDLALNLLCEGVEARLAALAHFAPDAPLRRHRLVALVGEPGALSPPLPGLYLKLEDGVLDHLLGFDHLAPQVVACVTRVVPQARLKNVLLPAEPAANLDRLARAGLPADGLVLHVHGPYGSGRRAGAEALCAAFGCELLRVDGHRVAAMTDADARDVIALIRRDAMLRQAAVYWDGFDALLDEARAALLRAVLAALADGAPVAFLAGERSFEPRDGMLTKGFARLEIARPGALERVELWRRALADAAQARPEDELVALASGFRLTGGEIRDAVTTARQRARWRAPADGAAVTLADLQAACRLHSAHGLSALGQKIDPRHGWDDLVLTADRIGQLREIANAIRYRARVHEHWGFGAKLSLGKGLAALFSGPPGTGKTMAAEVIARDLALDLYKIDLAAVVSKYIGETEKNLARIFAAAEASNAILFFDEADALFGKRAEVRDAHDRYANIETAYLLQRLEAYEGLVILATNLRKNMDEAFVRRLQMTIEFPMPAEAERARMWAGIWPAATPLSADVDLDVLARRFELAGGNIKNIALAAAFLAAAAGESVTMAHLMRATQREFQKMGRIIAPGELAVGGARAAGG
jgi:AAA+ superfamily predicted ATPase